MGLETQTLGWLGWRLGRWALMVSTSRSEKGRMWSSAVSTFFEIAGISRRVSVQRRVTALARFPSGTNRTASNTSAVTRVLTFAPLKPMCQGRASSLHNGRSESCMSWHAVFAIVASMPGQALISSAASVRHVQEGRLCASPATQGVFNCDSRCGEPFVTTPNDSVPFCVGVIESRQGHGREGS